MSKAEEKEYWRKLREEYPPPNYRDYVLCDPIPREDHLTGVDKKV